jgi:hypothetical protein
MPEESNTGASRFFMKKPDWVLNRTGANNIKTESKGKHAATTPPPNPASPIKAILSPHGTGSGEDQTAGTDLFRRSRDTQKILTEREKKNAEKERKKKLKREREELKKQQEEEAAQQKLEEELETQALESVELDATTSRESKRRRISDENEDGRLEDRLNRATTEDSLYAATPRPSNRTIPVGKTETMIVMGQSPEIMDDDMVIGSQQFIPSLSNTSPKATSESQPGTQGNAIDLDLEPDSPPFRVKDVEYDLDTLPQIDDPEGGPLRPTTEHNHRSPTASQPLIIDRGPTIPIFISSDLPLGYPPTNSVIINRRYKQPLGRVREFWCQYNNLADPDHLESIVLTWKGEKVFDVATLEMMGVKYEVLDPHEHEYGDEAQDVVDSEDVKIRVLNGGDEDEVQTLDGTGTSTVKAMFGNNRAGGVHFVATTVEILEQRKREEEKMASQRVVGDEALQLQQDMNEADQLEDLEPPKEDRKYRVILRSKDLPDMKLLLKQATRISTTVERYRKGNQLGAEVSISLRFDDEELLPEQTIAETAIAEESLEHDDVVVIDVHIK